MNVAWLVALHVLAQAADTGRDVLLQQVCTVSPVASGFGSSARGSGTGAEPVVGAGVKPVPETPPATRIFPPF